MYSKIDSRRLTYVRTHQEELRVDSFIHLLDSINNDGYGNNPGLLFILPSNFTDGLRYVHEKSQDAMTYVRKYDRPDIFLLLHATRNVLKYKRNSFLINDRVIDVIL